MKPPTLTIHPDLRPAANQVTHLKILEIDESNQHKVLSNCILQSKLAKHQHNMQ